MTVEHIDCKFTQHHLNARTAVTILMDTVAHKSPTVLTVIFIWCLFFSLETTEDEVETNQSPLVDETTAVITNGGGEADPDVSERSNQYTTGGPVIGEDVHVTLEEGLMVDVSEGKPGPIPNVSISEEEEGTLVMRAERVIITDEGDDVPEDLMSQEDQLKTMQSEETPLPNLEAGQEGGEAVEEVIKTEAALGMLTQPEKSEATEPTAKAQPETAAGDLQGGVKTNAEGQGKILEDPTSVHVQPPAIALEGTTVSSVPVYCQSTLTTELEAEGAAAASPEGAETALKAQDPATLPGQFREVLLADPQANQRTEAGPEEQEPLLSQAKAPNSCSEPAANVSASTETHSPTRASQGQETEAPRRKTCQCCSVM